MEEKELLRGVRDFFTANEYGKELLKRWEDRLWQDKNRLPYADGDEGDELRGRIQAAEKYFFPEIKNSQHD